MTATLKKLAPTQVELEISISEGELDAARERAFRKLAKSARIPGFRPGKVPRKIFEQQYGTDAIAERAMDEVVPEAYSKALKEHDLDPVDRPQMELLPQEEGEPLRVRATVWVRPEITLGAYKGIELEEEAIDVADEDVEHSLHSLAREAAELSPVARAAQVGDFVIVDYLGTIDGEAFEGGSAENQTMELLEERFIPGFATGIAGMMPGEKKHVEATFPADYGVSTLAGKTADFAVTLHEVKVAVLPELDDDLAKRVSNSPTLADLRVDVKRRLEAVAAARARKATTSQLIDKLLAMHDFPLPDVLVDREVENLVSDSKAYIARQGEDWNSYLSSRGKTEEHLREDFRPEAERRVKGTLLLEQIAKAEGIEVTTADVDQELAALSQQYGQPKETILQMLRQNLSALIEGILRSKTIDFLLESAAKTGTKEPVVAD